MIQFTLEIDEKNANKLINFIIGEKDKIKKIVLNSDTDKIYKLYTYLKKSNVEVYLHPDTPLLKNLPF